jgi:hypothetical protein
MPVIIRHGLDSDPAKDVSLNAPTGSVYSNIFVPRAVDGWKD